MNKLYYSWEQLHKDTHKLCSLVEGLDFKPDAVVGIVRGGAVPAVIASHHFNVPVEMLNWSTRDSKKADFRHLDQLAISAGYGKKYLFIEDIVDSGKTMQEIKHRLYGANNNVLITSLFFNPNQTNATINLYINLIDRSIDDRWVEFPFES